MKAMIDVGRARHAGLRGRAREVVPAARVLRRLALARHVGARRRRRADEPGHSHRRRAALAVRPGRAGGRAHGDAAASNRGRGHGGGGHRVRERRARRHRGDHRRRFPATRGGSTSAEPRARSSSRGTVSSRRISAARQTSPSTLPAQPPPENAASATVSDSVPHQRIFEDFIRAIAPVRCRSVMRARPGRACAIIEAIYRSARSGKFERP